MLATTFDRPLVRFVLGALVGFPLSVVAIFATPHGLILGYFGLSERHPMALAGFATVLGVIAIFGAWYRILVPYKDLSSHQVRCIRYSLSFGVASSTGLAAWACSEAEYVASCVLGVLAVFGVILVQATPSPAHGLTQRDAP